MHTVGKTTLRDLRDDLFDVFELLTQGLPTVDDQEDIAERVVGDPAVGTHLAVGRHRVDALGRKTLFTSLQSVEDLGGGPSHLVGVQPLINPTDVRQVLHQGHTSTTEVQAVKLGFLGSVRQTPTRS